MVTCRHITIRGIAAGLVAATMVNFVQAEAPVAATASAPATARTRPAAPATATSPEDRPAFAPADPLPMAESVEDGLGLTEIERQGLVGVADRPFQLDEQGLYIVMRRAAALPKLGPTEWDALDRPSYENLLKRPEDYHLRPVRMTVLVNSVRRVEPGDGLATYSRWWPRGKAAWIIDGMVPRGDDALVTDRPIRLVSVAPPPELRREPERTGDDGASLYTAPGPPINAAGVFYKVVTLESRDRAMRDYPVLIAWQLESARPVAGTGFSASTMVTLIVLLLVLLAVGFIVLKRHIKGLRTRQREPARPEGEGEEGRPAPVEPADVDQVDPELRAAAESYRRERQDDDAADDKG